MAGILKVDTLQSDSNLALKIATANVAFIDSNGLNVVGGNLTIGATQFAEGGQVQTAGIADGAVTNDKIVSVANTKLSGLIVDSQIANVNASVISSGTLGAARLPTGSVLQVVSTAKTDTFTTTSSSFVDVTGLSATITPSSASSKILVMVSFYMSANSGSGYPIARMLRDSTAIYVGDSAGSRTPALVQTGGGLFTSDGGTGFNVSAQLIDSPATTSATTYKLQALQSAGNTARIGAGADDADASNRIRAAASIVLMEIAA